MKKIALLTLSAALVICSACSVWAGIFDEYNDYQNPDGTYSYYFRQGLKITLDDDWYHETFVKTGDRGTTFYHKASYDAWAQKGFEGGRLFTLGASVNSSFSELPSFEYIGFDEEEAMNYYAELPTDYQAYADDPEIRAEYDALWAGVRDVIHNIEIIKNDPGPSENTQSTTAMEQSPVPADGQVQVPVEEQLTGGWQTTVDAAVSEEDQKIFEKAMEGDALVRLSGMKYEPVALLATQVVAGTNRCFLSRMSADTPNASPFYVLVYIYEDLEGNVQLLEVSDLSIGLSAN